MSDMSEKDKEIKASLEAMIQRTVASMVSARDRLERDIHHNRIPNPGEETEYLANKFLRDVAAGVMPIQDQSWEDALFGAVYSCEERLRQITDFKTVKTPIQRAQDEIETSVLVNFMAIARRFT